MTKILTVANKKEGVGKTTFAAHLSIEAIKNGLKTILIDLDPRKNLESWWRKRVDDNPYLAEIDLIKFEDVINNIRECNFDLCIIDTPSDTSIATKIGLQAADLVLIPSKPRPSELISIGRTISVVKSLKKKYIFAITQVLTNSKLGLQGISVLSKFGVVIPLTLSNRTSYIEAIKEGSSSTYKDKVSAEELREIWSFVYSKLFNKDIASNNLKEKRRFIV